MCIRAHATRLLAGNFPFGAYVGLMFLAIDPARIGIESRRPKAESIESLRPSAINLKPCRIYKIDYWIGKNLFVPPIIKFCQLTRQSQFACSRLFWFVASLDAFNHAQTLGGSLLWGGMSLLVAFTATLRADNPTMSFRLFRLLGLVCLGYDLIHGASTGAWAGSDFWMLVLIAEYAATIRTLPPVEHARGLVEHGTLGQR